LRDGTKKMSKSDASDMARINMTDTEDVIAQKIRKAKTDPEPLPEHVHDLDARPEARNLVGIYGAIMGKKPHEVLHEFAGTGFGPFKSRLADVLIAHVEPIGNRTREFLADPTALDHILQAGARKAEAIAEPIVQEAERLVGFLPRG